MLAVKLLLVLLVCVGSAARYIPFGQEKFMTGHVVEAKVVEEISYSEFVPAAEREQQIVYPKYIPFGQEKFMTGHVVEAKVVEEISYPEFVPAAEREQQIVYPRYIPFGHEKFMTGRVVEAKVVEEISYPKFVPAAPEVLEVFEYLLEFESMSEKLKSTKTLLLQADNPFQPESPTKTKTMTEFLVDTGAPRYFIRQDLLESLGATIVGLCDVEFPPGCGYYMPLYAVQLVLTMSSSVEIAVNMTACSNVDVEDNWLPMLFMKHFGLCWKGDDVVRCYFDDL
jgi:hypothetical protein